MKAQDKEYPIKYDVRSKFCGFPEIQRNTQNLSIQLTTNTRLCVLNSYRKIMMAFYPSFSTDDRFLIPDFIEKRIQQIPLNLINYQLENPESMNFKLQVTNKLQEPMIVYTDHIFQEQTKNQQLKIISITSGLQITDTYNLFKLQEGCYVTIEMGLMKQLPESDDKFRGCFVSVFEDESEDVIDEYTYVSERKQSQIIIKTYGSMNKYEFAQFFATQYIENLLNADILIRVDKLQTSIVFNNIPIFIVDAILCLNKDYFYQYFQSVMPTSTNDYQSCLLLTPKPSEQKQTQEDLQTQLQLTIKNFIELMQEFEHQVIQAL